MPKAKRAMAWQLGMLDRGHDTCIHKNYLLSCEDYERLLARSGGFCEMCGMPGFETPGGKLHIDHDRGHGDWAVRGLLCAYCNTNLHRKPVDHPAVVAFMAQSWFREMLRSHGIVPGVYPEPPRSAYVFGPNGRRFRYKDRGKRQGWARVDDHHKPWRFHMPEPWAHLVKKYGPHNLRTVTS